MNPVRFIFLLYQWTASPGVLFYTPRIFHTPLNSMTAGIILGILRLMGGPGAL